MLTLTGAALLGLLAFNLFYGIGDIAVLYIPVYLVIGIWLAIGLAALVQTGARLARGQIGRLPLIVPAVLLVWPLAWLVWRFPLLDLSQQNKAAVWWAPSPRPACASAAGRWY